MEKDFIYWRHHTPIGVKVEEISGGADRSGAVWRAMALQVWKENGRDGYRDLDHTEQGAPLLYAEHNRISLTHTQGLTHKVRERYLGETELALVPGDFIEANVTAWTCKEALYKAALMPGLDWRRQIRLLRLPVPDGETGSAEVEIEGKPVPFLLYTYRSDDFLVTLAITPRTATFKKQKR